MLQFAAKPYRSEYGAISSCLHRLQRSSKVGYRWDQVALIGIGLLGGSIGLALRRSQLARHIVGMGRNPDRLAQALQAGVITQVAETVESAVAEAEIVVVATPVNSVPDLVRTCALAAKKTHLLTDVGSTKSEIVDQLSDLPTDVPFVGSHPLAGSEQSGFEFAREDLLDDKIVFVTPTDNTDTQVVENAHTFWESLGARVHELSAETHDRLMAHTSHLPHLIASALAGSASIDHPDFYGRGFRDTTRLASGNVEMWVPILLQNREFLLQAVQNFQSTLGEWEQALSQCDSTNLKRLLIEGKKHRDSLGS